MAGDVAFNGGPLSAALGVQSGSYCILRISSWGVKSLRWKSFDFANF